MADVFRPMRLSDVPAFERWFSDEETSSRIAKPDVRWCRHVFDSPTNRCWVVEAEDGLAAVIQADQDQEAGVSICLVVDPARRRQGYGTKALWSFLQAERPALLVVKAMVEPDNQAGLALARRCGFESMSDAVDDDGMLRFRHMLQS